MDNSTPQVNTTNQDDPTWYKDAVIYQLHLKSFFDSNNDGIGDFPGLISKLDYIAELGVDTIWLLPFYPSPRRDDGYDIAEYRGVHEDYGTIADLRRLIAEAHARGIRVITELVINHTSDQHPWFQRARNAPAGSPERDFYVWSDNDQAYAGTRVIFLDTEKSNWTWDPVANAYFWHRFYSHQPDLNFDNPAVLKEVLGVMRFWLDLGVDGLRLDAVPYLIEREGTNNENLQETHDILKQIRANLDASYKNRLLLAEANQWPEDAQEYFGQGDECHMSFHFPLMPRMYMAIAREDRFPITDIMRQTPDIPADCQWAIFLRNHDELTLEMVTSSERDYLWNFYAADRRARINLGIRRRLAPLLERDRRRIELMNSLLLSMPGTPVIYYGDEIGMGDNIHLGDRDGVRTPMQWSPDRNGGFSRADPESLVLPALNSSLYGYEAVNVEAQHRDAHSLLNWMRRMLAKRRQHCAFGRGTLSFLYPGNRKILAYVRQHEQDTILCVVNLSNAPQAVELDLSAYKGRVPVELLGGTPFPPIGELTYLLTLPPYGFYWFELSTDAAPPSWHTQTSEQMPEFATLVLRDREGYQLMEGSRKSLELEVLPAYLARRRWFASKDRVLESARVVHAAALAGNRGDLYFAEIEAMVGGQTERYAMPVKLVWDDSMSPLEQQLAIAGVRRGPQVGKMTDAFASPAFALSMIDHWKKRSELSIGPGAKLVFRTEPGLDAITLSEQPPIHWLSAEQSNSSLIVESKLVLKVVRRIAPGIHPEAEMTRYLTARGYRNIGLLMGELVRIGENGTPSTLAILQANIPNQGNAWEWTLNYLNGTLDNAALTGETVESYEEELAGYGALAAAIGRRLAELHAVLASPSEDPAFAPEAADAAMVKARAEEVREMLQKALDALGQPREWADPAVKQLADDLIARRDDLLDTVGRLADFGVGDQRVRIHGDFHLGQVLVAQADAYLIDFEGEPARAVEARRKKSSPMRDVAGLLRSFDYAAATLDKSEDPTKAQSDPANASSVPAAQTVRQRRMDLLERFRRSASRAFLDAYFAGARTAAHPWVNPQTEGATLDLALLEKAAYEIVYEAANRPTWIGIPVRGLHELALRLLHPEHHAIEKKQ
jgi:maltose alpha-D-glucosyltransferase/alpha-amylase